MYINQYNQTNSHIDHLLDMLDEIRNNIQNVILSNQPRPRYNNRFNNRFNRTPSRTHNTNLNRYVSSLLGDTSYQDLYYDYAAPINPSIYTTRRREDATLNTDLNSFLNNFLNTSVSVRPTVEQILNASRIVRYGDIDNPLSLSCPISLDPFNTDDMVRQLLPCGHLFCQQSFTEWFRNNVRCPVCRYDIRNYVNNTSTTQVPETSEHPTSSNSSEIDDEGQEPINSSETEPPLSNTFSNVNILRDPHTNQIEQLAFDINNNTSTTDILNNITTRLFQSLLSPINTTTETGGTTGNANDRFFFDASNNILLYETIIRPNVNTDRSQ
jgi:hypothetical protein